VSPDFSGFTFSETSNYVPVTDFVLITSLFFVVPDVRNGSGAVRKKAGAVNQCSDLRQPGCLSKTLWAFRPTLADGLVLSVLHIQLIVLYGFHKKKNVMVITKSSDGVVLSDRDAEYLSGFITACR